MFYLLTVIPSLSNNHRQAAGTTALVACFFYFWEAYDVPKAVGGNIILRVDILSAVKDEDF